MGVVCSDILTHTHTHSVFNATLCQCFEVLHKGLLCWLGCLNELITISNYSFLCFQSYIYSFTDKTFMFGNWLLLVLFCLQAFKEICKAYKPPKKS